MGQLDSGITHSSPTMNTKKQAMAHNSNLQQDCSKEDKAYLLKEMPNKVWINKIVGFLDAS